MSQSQSAAKPKLVAKHRGGATATAKSLDFENWWHHAYLRLDSDKVKCVNKVVDFTGCQHSHAEKLLVVMNWKVDRAVDKFFTNSSTPTPTIFDCAAIDDHETEEVSLLCSTVMPCVNPSSTIPETSQLSVMFKMGAEAATTAAERFAMMQRNHVADLEARLRQREIEAAVQRVEEEGRRRLQHIEEQYEIMLTEMRAEIAALKAAHP